MSSTNAGYALYGKLGKLFMEISNIGLLFGVVVAMFVIIGDLAPDCIKVLFRLETVSLLVCICLSVFRLVCLYCMCVYIIVCECLCTYICIPKRVDWKCSKRCIHWYLFHDNFTTLCTYKSFSEYCTGFIHFNWNQKLALKVNDCSTTTYVILTVLA